MKKLRLMAASLLLFSCFSHFGEAVVIAPKHAMGSMLFGVIYFVLGLMLFMKHPKAYISTSVFVSIGLILAIGLSLTGAFSLFMLIHIAIDIFVLYVCLKHYKKI